MLCVLISYCYCFVLFCFVFVCLLWVLCLCLYLFVTVVVVVFRGFIVDLFCWFSVIVVVGFYFISYFLHVSVFWVWFCWLVKTSRSFWSLSTFWKQNKIKTNKQTNKNTQNDEPNGRKEGNVLFNDALNTCYLRLYGVRHMVKDHSDSETGNPLFFSINSKGSFISTIPQTG